MWSLLDDGRLTQLWALGMPAMEIGHRLDRTASEVQARALVLRLPPRPQRPQRPRFDGDRGSAGPPPRPLRPADIAARVRKLLTA